MSTSGDVPRPRSLESLSQRLRSSVRDSLRLALGKRPRKRPDCHLSEHQSLPAMASAALRKELECSVCLNVYSEPVTLSCGHNFCRGCIDCVLDSQMGSGGYSCPECREKFQERPSLQTNKTLQNIVGDFLFTQPDQEDSGTFCAHCTHAPVPAVMSCLTCDASLCENHLRVFSTAPELAKKRCSIHENEMDPHCAEDPSCVCVSCYIISEHKELQAESFGEAPEKKIKNLRTFLQEVINQREEAEDRVQILKERRRKAQEKSDRETERVNALFAGIRRRLEELEKKVLRDVTRQAERLSLLYNGVIQELELKNEELSGKIRHIEELCHISDPLNAGGDLSLDGDQRDKKNLQDQLHDRGDLDVTNTADTLQKGLMDIISGMNVCFYIQDPADMLVDKRSANNYVLVSEDRKTISWLDNSLNHPPRPERFEDVAQAMTAQCFSKGQHYWEVDVTGTQWWRVGMCYPSIARSGDQSGIGYNNKSWCLRRYHNYYLVIHDGKVTQLPVKFCSDGVRVYVDYEAGQISFFALCDPIRHLYTYTATFTEPLHGALGLWRGFMSLSRGDWDILRQLSSRGANGGISQ
ncbi:E3 ubiquitin-protein ligase TRIM21-like [Hyperolius riggenbachi]|uniref:E3 ubiquitin-protein ligase TRIM21-like n=1 Tax=Hyperolius riggenbachi TaxID=752182 RepID=UPI0035A2E01B